MVVFVPHATMGGKLRRCLENQGEKMEKLNGVFDNQETMQREAWIDGEMAGQWPAAMCGSTVQAVMPWERQALEKLWGAYPNPA